MNGIILVNKDKNMTSHDVVNKIRKIFKTKKVGHIGTLDPLAEGLLAVCINDATKLVQFLQEHDKIYEARVCLGIKTDTFDLEGKIVDETKLQEFDPYIIDNAIASFVGCQKQVPPIYSSIKVNGKKLYEYARNNEEVEIPIREIEVYEIKRISEIELIDNKVYFDLFIHASKGTYIRSICNDLGEKLNIPSTMASLKRVKNGNFELSNASTLTEIEQGNYRLYNMLDALDNYVVIEDEIINHFAKNGRIVNSSLIKKHLTLLPKQVAFKEKDSLLAIYELDSSDMMYKAVRVWN